MLLVASAAVMTLFAAGLCAVHVMAPSQAVAELPAVPEREVVVSQKEALGCPACTPDEAPKLDVVIPFFERDLCKLKYTVRSLGVHDPDGVLGDIFLLWVSEQPSSKYSTELKEVTDAVSGDRQVHLVDFQPIVKSTKVNGWFAQQILKLKIASAIVSDFYMVLDAKNTFIKDIKADALFTPCHQAKIFAEYAWDTLPEPHATWYQAAQNLLDIHGAEDHPMWPASITPFIFHKQTTLDLLRDVHEEPKLNVLCSHGEEFCRKLGVRSLNASDQNHPTEFTLYTSYAYGKTNLECAHKVISTDPDSPDLISRSLWRGMEETREDTMQQNLEILENITAGRLNPIAFGSQPSALDFMTNGTKAEAVKYVTQIYSDAGLYDASSTSANELITCAIGVYNLKIGV
jgi:hypothetical protein